MQIGAMFVNGYRSLKTLAYSAFVPTDKGKKWEAVEVQDKEGNYSSEMRQVPSQGVLKDIAGHAIDGLSVGAPLSMIGKGTTATFFAKTNAGKTTAAEITKDIVKADNLANNKYTIGELKTALSEVHEKVGSLPKGAPGKFGSPQRGNGTKGYRLDPAHAREAGNPESVPHINWWDGTNGMKRGKGLVTGVVPIKEL